MSTWNRDEKIWEPYANRKSDIFIMMNSYFMIRFMRFFLFDEMEFYCLETCCHFTAVNFKTVMDFQLVIWFKIVHSSVSFASRQNNSICGKRIMLFFFSAFTVFAVKWWNILASQSLHSKLIRVPMARKWNEIKKKNCLKSLCRSQRCMKKNSKIQSFSNETTKQFWCLCEFVSAMSLEMRI